MNYTDVMTLSSSVVHSAGTNNCIGQSTVGYYSAPEKVVLSIATALFCLVGLIGNVAVIVVICKDRVISRHRQNLYLLSLAVSDVSLIVLVVPFSLANELLGMWPFGDWYCRIYLSVDILLCTASIWNICLIGLDRYVSVSYPTTYRKFRTVPRIRLFILGVWIFASVVSALPFIGEHLKINGENGCSINDSSWYIILSTFLSFFLPTFIVWPIYLKIYCVGRNLEIRRRARTSSNFNDEKLMTQSRQPSQYGDRLTSAQGCEKTDLGTQSSRKDTHFCLPNCTEEMRSLKVFENGAEPAVPCNLVRASETPKPDFIKDALNSQLCSTNDQLLPNPSYRLLSQQEMRSAAPARDEEGPTAVNRGRSFAAAPSSRTTTFPGIRLTSKCKGEHSFLNDCCNKFCCHTIVKRTVQVTQRPNIEVSMATDHGTGRVGSHAPEHSVSLVTANIKNNRIHRESTASQMSSCAAFSRRERRFVLVISIVMGCFMICWLPFFLTYFIYAVCRPSCCINNKLFIVFFWLGYLNSAINPILYTIFNKDFRGAFRRLLRRLR